MHIELLQKITSEKPHENKFENNIILYFFFLISKKNFYKKRKAPLGTQDVYTETTKANPKKPTTPRAQNTKEPNKIQKNPTKNNKTHYPSRHNRPTTYVPCLSYA